MGDFLKITFSWIYLLSIAHILSAAVDVLFRDRTNLMFAKLLPLTMIVVWIGSVLLVSYYLK